MAFKMKKRFDLALIEDVLLERLGMSVETDKLNILAREILDILIERGYLNED